MKSRLLGTVPMVALLGALGVSAAELPADTARYLEQATANGQLVGVVVAYVDGNDTVIRGFGVASKETGKPPDANTVFEIGSITKTFTAALLAEEVLGGKVKLTDPVQKYLPEGITLAQVGERPIELVDVATQRSGLPRMPSNFTPANQADPFADFDEKKLWDAVNTVKPARAPGAAYEYSNLGFGVLGAILAREAGMSYRDLVKARIFAPLGMTSTDTVLTDALRQRSAQGYGPGGVRVDHWTIVGMAGAGAINSTATDMLAYVRANMAASAAASAKPLSRAFAMAHELRADMTPEAKMQIGLAWMTTPTGGARWHNGGTGGFMSFAGFTEDGKRGVVVLSNQGFRPVDQIGFHLLNAAAALPEIRTEITLAPEKFDELVGRYELSPQAAFTVTRASEGLYVQLTGQNALPVYAYAPDKFFSKIVDAQFSFERGADGKIVALTLHQNGQNVRADRLGADGKSLAPAVAQLALSAEQLDAYVGRYQLTPQLVFSIARDGSQLNAQLTGQPALPIYADKPDHFFYKVVDAQLDFARDAAGKVSSVTLHQAGRDLPAPRVD
jgi:D-alanyl-D-alanine-carboxypeptidase/D-alanyl-D-alanine-endopeptidase